MRPSQRTSRFHLDEVGGAANRIRPIAQYNLERDATEGHDVDAELYPDVPLHPAWHRHSNSRNRLKALAIAEARLNRVCDELLDLADEIRYLHPSMAEAIDDAWNGADTALETLLDEDAW